MINPRAFSFLFAALLLAPAPFAQAQDQAQTAAEDEKTVEVGQFYRKEAVGEWGVRCVRAPIGQSDPCQIYQILRDAEGNQVVELSVTRLAQPNGDAVAKMDIFMPLETFLPPGIRVAIDSNDIGRVPILFCNRARCVSEVPLKAVEVDAFKRGGAATFTISPAAAPDQPISLSASLTGFTKGYDSLPGGGQ